MRCVILCVSTPSCLRVHVQTRHLHLGGRRCLLPTGASHISPGPAHQPYRYQSQSQSLPVSGAVKPSSRLAEKKNALAVDTSGALPATRRPCLSQTLHAHVKPRSAARAMGQVRSRFDWARRLGMDPWQDESTRWRVHCAPLVRSCSSPCEGVILFGAWILETLQSLPVVARPAGRGITCLGIASPRPHIHCPCATPAQATAAASPHAHPRPTWSQATCNGGTISPSSGVPSVRPRYMPPGWTNIHFPPHDTLFIISWQASNQ